MSAREPTSPPRRRRLLAALVLGLVDARDDLEASQLRLSVARNAPEGGTDGCTRDASSRTDNGARHRAADPKRHWLLAMARDMRSAELDGPISDYNPLVGDINEKARHSNRLLSQLRRDFAAFQ